MKPLLPLGGHRFHTFGGPLRVGGGEESVAKLCVWLLVGVDPHTLWLLVDVFIWGHRHQLPLPLPLRGLWGLPGPLAGRGAVS